MLRFTSKRLFTPFNRQLIANMGGHALTTVPCARVDLKVYNEIKKDVKEKLEFYIDIDFAYDRPGKTDFGDVDVLYKHRTNNVYVHELVQQIFNPEEIFNNFGVLSFSYYHEETAKFVQVDLVKVQDMEMGKFYFSWGDCGNILGHITSFHFLKFGQRGLFMSPNPETLEEYDGTLLKATNTNYDILLSNNPADICRFLGLDYETWKNFQTVEEVFEWIKSCRLFRSHMYNRVDNAEQRYKLAERPMYAAFYESTLADAKKGHKTGASIKRNQQLEAIKFFGKEQELEEIIADLKRADRRKRMFNGYKFMPFGYMGTELGDIIVNFKRSIVASTGKGFFDWLDEDVNENEAMIDEKIASFAATYNKLDPNNYVSNRTARARTSSGSEGEGEGEEGSNDNSSRESRGSADKKRFFGKGSRHRGRGGMWKRTVRDH